MYEDCAVNGTEWREEISSGMVKPEARQHALCCAGTEDANQKEGEQNESNPGSISQEGTQRGSRADKSGFSFLPSIGTPILTFSLPQ